MERIYQQWELPGIEQEIPGSPDHQSWGLDISNLRVQIGQAAHDVEDVRRCSQCIQPALAADAHWRTLQAATCSRHPALGKTESLDSPSGTALHEPQPGRELPGGIKRRNEHQPLD